MTDYSIARVNPAGWAQGDQIHPDDHADALDINVKTLGDYAETLRLANLRNSIENSMSFQSLGVAVDNAVAVYATFGSGKARWIVYTNLSSKVVAISSYDGHYFLSAIALESISNAPATVAMGSTHIVVDNPGSTGIKHTTTGTSLVSATAPAKTYVDLFYDGTNLIGSATDGTFAISTDDGVNWADASGQPSVWDGGNYNGAQMADNGSRVIAVPSTASANRFAYSDDNGDNWSEASVVALSGGWHGIAYSAQAGLWLAIGNNGTSPFVYQSSDGLSWNSAATLTGYVSGAYSKLYMHEEYFVTVLSVSGGSPFLAYSKDGVTWYRGVTLGIFGSETPSHLAYGNGQFLYTALDATTSLHAQVTPKAATATTAL